ncbi:MAG: hypothetical protein JSW64_15865, partial [Candidatus Zixiibacteriota bacterium]
GYIDQYNKGPKINNSKVVRVVGVCPRSYRSVGLSTISWRTGRYANHSKQGENLPCSVRS